MKNNFIIFGGTSLISFEIISILEKKEKNNFYYIFCRNKKKFFFILENSYKNIDIKKLIIIEADLLDIDKNLVCLEQILNENKINGLFFLVGESNDFAIETYRNNDLQKIYDINLINPVKIINFISSRITNEAFIVAITSIAGMRGRRLRIHYCSAKAGLINYLSGLRQKLYNKKIKVIDIRAGYISTEKFKQKVNNFFISTPRQISKLIYSSIKNNRKTVYSKPIWFLVSIILQLIPDFIFQKLKF